jgi:hypothetical protein
MRMEASRERGRAEPTHCDMDSQANTPSRRASAVTDGEDAAQIAEAMGSVWQEIAESLGPIIGRGGVDALYRRSLHLTFRAYPWLAGAQAGEETVMDLTGLKAVLAEQDSANAAAGGGALLQTFYDLLTGVIGPSLTARLLRSAWASAVSRITLRGTPL